MSGQEASSSGIVCKLDDEGSGDVNVVHRPLLERDNSTV